MRSIAIFLVAMLCVAGWARAEDFQIGGEQQDETVVPLEIRPSLGLYVQAYVNGYGPYRFGIGMFGHTALTSAVVRDAGLASEAKGLTLAGNSNQLAQNKQLVDGTLRLGDRNFSLKWCGARGWHSRANRTYFVRRRNPS